MFEMAAKVRVAASLIFSIFLLMLLTMPALR